MRVLVTGANGFVGRRLLETHAGEHELSRSRGRAGPSSPGVEWIEHDLVEPLAHARLPEPDRRRRPPRAVAALSRVPGGRP